MVFDQQGRIVGLPREYQRALNDWNIVLIPAPNIDPLYFVGQIWHRPGEAILEFGKGRLQIRAPLEFDTDETAATRGIGTKRLDPRNLGDGLFEAVYYLFLDLDRTGIGIGGPDEELGEVEAFGNEHQRDARIGDIAHHQQ